MGVMQEKFQAILPSNGNDNSHSGWVSDASARVKKGLSGKGQVLPPGMNIEDQSLSDQRGMKLTMSGESDVSQDYSAGAVKKGFTKRRMLPTDDMYTNEHNDAFYGECTVDGDTGFLERNNMLDRL